MALLTRDRLTTTAYHEAGHAILAWAGGYEVKELSIVRQGDSFGRILFTPLSPANQLNTMRSVIMGAGGMAADMIHWEMNGEDPSEFIEGDTSDRERMSVQLTPLGFQDPIVIDLCLNWAIKFLRRHDVWVLVDQCAQTLLQSTALSEDRISSFAVRVPLVTEADIAELLSRFAQFREAGIRTVADLHSRRTSTVKSNGNSEVSDEESTP